MPALLLGKNSSRSMDDTRTETIFLAYSFQMQKNSVKQFLSTGCVSQGMLLAAPQEKQCPKKSSAEVSRVMLTDLTPAL